MQVLNNKMFTLADRQVKHTITKNNCINIDINTFKINNKHYIIASKDEHYIYFLKNLIKHEYCVSNIYLNDIVTYCEHTDNNLIIIDNMYCNIDTQGSFIETSIYEQKSK
jgi:hypothetical protein